MTYLEAGKEVLSILHSASYEAYFVGGMVRDSILGIEFHDIDITTNANSDQIVSLFPKTFNKGVKFQSITVLHEGYEFEVTTYRIDLGYSDSRHPSATSKASSLKEDVMRRDFTINAMAMDIEGNIIDYCNGRADLDNKLIRTVNDPNERFTEDALRMLRACYFASKLNFTIETNSYQAICKNASKVQNISSERVLEEIKKILLTKNSLVGFKYLRDSGIVDFIPEIKFGVEWFLAKKVLTSEILLFLAVTSYNNGEVSEYFKITSASRNKINRAISLALVTENADFNKLLLYSYGLEVSLLANSINVILGKNQDLRKQIASDYEALPIKKTCDLAFKGQDIMMMFNREPGYWINDMVDRIKYEVIMGNIPNDYEQIKDFVTSNYM